MIFGLVIDERVFVHCERNDASDLSSNQCLDYRTRPILGPPTRGGSDPPRGAARTPEPPRATLAPAKVQELCKVSLVLQAAP